MEFSLDKTPEEEINDFFNLYLDEAKLHDAGFGNQILSTKSFEEAVDKVLEYLETHKNIPQTAKDTGVTYKTPLKLSTKIITQTFNSNIHLSSGISNTDAQSGYYKNPEQKHISKEGIGLYHILLHEKHWVSYYENIISKNKYYEEKLENAGINKNNSNLKNMLLFAKYAIENGKCKNQQKRPNIGDHIVSIVFDNWNIVFGYDDKYLGNKNNNDFTYLETMYYLKADENKTDSKQQKIAKQQKFLRQQQNNNQKNTEYINSLKNKTHPNYDKIKQFDDQLSINNTKTKKD